MESAVARVSREGGRRVATNRMILGHSKCWGFQAHRSHCGWPLVVRVLNWQSMLLATVVGGRWSLETRDFLRALAVDRARSEPPLLRKRVEKA